MPTRLSAVRCRLATRVTLRQLLLSVPFFNSSDWRSLPTSGHVENSGPNPLSGFAPKQTKGSSVWRTTYIVLHVWSIFIILHKSPCIIFPTLPYLVLESFCASLHHSIIIWLSVSSLSPDDLHFFCFFCFLHLIFLGFNRVSHHSVVFCYYYYLHL